MRFSSEELNRRIEIFSKGKYKEIIGEEAPPVYKLEELKKDLFTTLSRFNVTVEDTTYECAFSPSVQKKLYVFLSGAGPRQNLRANFDRISWHQYFNGCCINIEDPTYKIRNINQCWGGYFGNERGFYVDGVIAILRKIQDVYTIPNTSVFLIGSSAGGFASLHICARNDGYTCLVRNPQIFLGTKELGDIQKLGNPCFKERLSLGDIIARNYSSRFFIMFNRCSDWDMSNFRQLLAKLGSEDVSSNYYRFDNKQIVVMETDIREPHNNHCCSFPATVLARWDGYPPEDFEHMILSLLNANQERCGLQDRVKAKDQMIADLKKQLEKKEADMRETSVRDLWTSRIDIKNCGSHTGVSVTNLQESHPLDITEPSWFKNEVGQGVVVEGSSGYAKLSLRFTGDGLLVIDLRGITRLGVYQERLPYWITFLYLRVNGKDILSNPVDVWHDQPVTCKKKVEDGEVMILEYSWCPCRRSVTE